MAKTAMHRLSDVSARRKSHHFGFVLLSQFALIAIYPLAGSMEDARPGAFGVLAMAVFLAGLYQVAAERHIRLLGIGLCALGMSANILPVFNYRGPLLIPSGLCAIAYMIFVTVVILWKVLTSSEVTVQTLYGAASAYLFIGIVWGMAYSLVDQISPGAFRYTYDATRHLAWADYSFFSVVTLTTIGYGDIVAVGRVKSLVMMEGIIGAMYAPILIGRLLSLPARAGAPSLGTQNKN